MSKISKIILLIASIGIVCLLIFITTIYSAFNYDNMCGTKLIKSELSPDKKNKIIVFSQNCGAISDFSTQISIADSKYVLKNDDIGNIFSADSDHNKAEMHGEIIQINAKWLNDETISIDYAEKSRVFKNDKKLDNIVINYEIIKR